MSTAKNPSKSAIAYLKKYFVLVSILSLLLMVAAVYAANQIYAKKDHSPEYIYQDKSGTKVVLQTTQCGYSVEILKSMSEQFGKMRDQVKALTIHGDGWKKEGCWIKIEKTNEIAVSTEPGKIDTVLELDQFEKLNTTESIKAGPSKAESKSIKSFFSKDIDPTKQDTFIYLPVDPDLKTNTLFTFSHDVACSQVWKALPGILERSGLNPYEFKAGKMEYGLMKDGQWVVYQTNSVCFKPESGKKEMLVLVGREFSRIPYSELSAEPFKLVSQN